MDDASTNDTGVHYVCTGGCQGVAPVAGTCGATTCPKHGLPLTECHCSDGKHLEAFEHDNEESSL